MYICHDWDLNLNHGSLWFTFPWHTEREYIMHWLVNAWNPVWSIHLFTRLEGYSSDPPPYKNTYISGVGASKSDNTIEIFQMFPK